MYLNWLYRWYLIVLSYHIYVYISYSYLFQSLKSSQVHDSCSLSFQESHLFIHMYIRPLHCKNRFFRCFFPTTNFQPPQGFQTVCCMSLQLFWAVSVPIINCLGISSPDGGGKCDFTDCIWLGCFSEWTKGEGRNQSHHHGWSKNTRMHRNNAINSSYLSICIYI